VANRITRLVFWAGGVVLPTLPEVTASFLAPGRPATLAERSGLQEAAHALASGQDDPGQYCARAAGAFGEPGATHSTPLYERLTAGVDALPGMPDLIAETALTLEVRLVADYPAVWLLPALARNGLKHCFPADEISYVADLGGFAGALDDLIAAGVILPGHTLWVDAHSPRTSQALRKGVDANIFVDARRLRRDLALWRLMPLSA
jgi:hypothetical protein